MIIVTCANSDVAKNSKGQESIEINFRFTKVILATARNAKRFGYTTDIYDLGDLGIGTPYRVEDKSFSTTGHYEREPIKGYQSKSLFKPALMKACLAKHKQLTVYLDGDAELRRPIDEVRTDDYDVGVTLRDRCELDTDWYKSHKEIVRFLNAGVIFFNFSEATFEFIERWEKLTDEVGNDQMALNTLACPDDYPEPGSIRVIDGVRVKYFPCVEFNYYYFYEKLPLRAKIYHYKGDVRALYPFNWFRFGLSVVYVPFKDMARFLAQRFR